MNHRARKPYLVFPRPSKKFRQLYYVQFRLPDGSLSVPHACGQTSGPAAETWAVEQIKSGAVERAQMARNRRDDLIAFLLDFWDFDRSKYVRGKLARGGSISRAYCQCMTQMVGKYVKPTFAGSHVSALTADQFDDWMADLAGDDVPPRTINLARQSVNTPLNNLVELRRLPWNPLSAVKPYRENPTKRGTLTPEEYRKLLALDGLDPRVHLAIVLGGLCGARLGEVRGLRWADVDTAARVLRIHTSFVEVDGERDQAKHGSNRDVPLSSAVEEALTGWKRESPAAEDSDFILYDTENTAQPMGGEDIRQGYYAALDLIGIKDADRKSRVVVFHSLRYFYNTQLRGSIPEEVLRRFTGHHSEEMTDLYDAGKEIDFQKARAKLEELAAPEARVVSG